jgi:hypothetical protein
VLTLARAAGLVTRSDLILGLKRTWMGLILMADDEHAADAVPRLLQEYIGQLRAATERFQDFARAGQRLQPDPGTLKPPGALSAAQIAAIADSIAAQRRSIQALQTQLSAFDEQLAVLEQVLGPFAQWSKTWADLERRILDLGLWPGTGD